MIRTVSDASSSEISSSNSESDSAILTARRYVTDAPLQLGQQSVQTGQTPQVHDPTVADTGNAPDTGTQLFCLRKITPDTQV